MLKVYLPSPQRPSTLGAGAGVIGSGELSQGCLLVYYQPRSSALNIVTFADRCYHAAARLRERTPTHQMCALPVADLREIGYFDETEGRVVLTAADGEHTLAAWLGQAQLDAHELDCLGTAHFAHARELRAAAHSPNPVLAQWARTQAQRQSLSV